MPAINTEWALRVDPWCEVTFDPDGSRVVITNTSLTQLATADFVFMPVELDEPTPTITVEARS